MFKGKTTEDPETWKQKPRNKDHTKIVELLRRLPQSYTLMFISDLGRWQKVVEGVTTRPALSLHSEVDTHYTVCAGCYCPQYKHNKNQMTSFITVAVSTTLSAKHPRQKNMNFCLKTMPLTVISTEGKTQSSLP